MTPGEIVESFVAEATRCLDALAVKYVGTERPTVWTGLFLSPRGGGEPARSGELERLGSFTMHGRGCQFELESGADVDIAWDNAGRAVFDSWRILMYARSIGEGSVSQESLREVASDLGTIVRLGPDAFTWPDARYDVTAGDD